MPHLICLVICKNIILMKKVGQMCTGLDVLWWRMDQKEPPAVTPYLTAASRNRLKALALLLDIVRKILLEVEVVILTRWAYSSSYHASQAVSYRVAAPVHASVILGFTSTPDSRSKTLRSTILTCHQSSYILLHTSHSRSPAEGNI